MKQTAAALINLLTVLIIFASVSIPAVHADDHYKFKNKNIHSIFDKKITKKIMEMKLQDYLQPGCLQQQTSIFWSDFL